MINLVARLRPTPKFSGAASVRGKDLFDSA
jgi:hypothetical protein